MPDVRSHEGCRRRIATLEDPVYRGCFTLIYAYGLRISEAVTLPVSAVDWKEMVLRVIGKRNKERVLPLTESILQMLREVWRTHRSRRWLFPSRRLATHLPDATARAAFIQARNACGFNADFRPHSLRHSFATHMRQRGVSLSGAFRLALDTVLAPVCCIASQPDSALHTGILRRANVGRGYKLTMSPDSPALGLRRRRAPASSNRE